MPIRPAPDRREFLTAIAASTTLPAMFRGDPYRPVSVLRPSGSVRVRGRVHAAGRGLGRVAVSDGVSVVATDRDGRFDFVSKAGERYVTVSIPAGYDLPVQPAGTARCFSRISPNARGEALIDFPLAPLAAPDDEHGFLLLADIQTQNRADFDWFLRESVPDLKKTVGQFGPMPLFGVAGGDIMWDELQLYDDYERVVKDLGVPFIQVVGNHDLDLGTHSDRGSTETFARRFGPRYYSFNRGEIHYVVLDDVHYYGGGYIGYIDDLQLDWLRGDLALVEPGRRVVVFLHIPLSTSIATRQGLTQPGLGTMVTNREALYRILEPYETLVLSGHIHESAVVTRGRIVERNQGAVCGAWWTGPICYDGTPHGYGVYRVKGREIRPEYRAAGRAAEHQIRVYPRGADPTAPDEIVANVWAWEPGWQVTWYEGADRRGAMARRTGRDPLSVKLHSGPDLPLGRGFVNPVPTDHLFYAPVSAATAGIRVEAVDPFGRRYSELLAPGG